MGCDDESIGRRIDQILRGLDPDGAFRKVFDCFFRPLLAFFWRLRVPAEDRRDLAQETLIRVFRNLAGFRRGSKFDTWLFQIARNLAKNYWRERGAAKRSATEVSTTALEEVGREVADHDLRPRPLGNPEVEASGRQRIERLHRALLQLSPQARRCVQLTLEERPQREIAFLLGLKEGTVKAHMSHARKRLRQLLEDLEVDGESPGEATGRSSPHADEAIVGKAGEDDASLGDASEASPPKKGSEDDERRDP